MDFIKEWIGLALVALGGVTAWFNLKSTVATLKTESTKQAKAIATLEDDVDQLEINQASAQATRDQMLEMLKENRLDVKSILQSIATLAAQVSSDKKGGE